MNDRPDTLVIGAGPAGLMAAQILAQAGQRVIIADAMPSPARKFLMAGKSGLNLTKAEPLPDFTARITGFPALTEAVADFGPDGVQDWARSLGANLFTGSTGRVFPVEMKASPLLRSWLAVLRERGVDLRMRWRWTGMGDGFTFDTPQGIEKVFPKHIVLALGGASWPRLGSDGAWVPILSKAGVPLAPFRPANMGFNVDWSAPMARHFGAAVKGTALSAGGITSRGEWIISASGIEGGGVYEIAAPLREGATGSVDLAPDLDLAALTAKFTAPKRKLSIGNWLRRILGDPVKVALLLGWGRPLPVEAVDWARLTKALPLRHNGAMGLGRAISSAGGIKAEALSPWLELTALPGIFAAGEMLDWEAPTGGYLLTACLASGRRAAQGVLRQSAAAR